VNAQTRTQAAAVVGVGNILMADDGIGPAVIRALAVEDLPEGVGLYDAGTALMDVLPQVECCERLIIVDSCAAGGPPGAVYRWHLHETAWQAGPMGDSLHHLDVLQSLTLHLVAGGRLGEVTVIGVEPAEVLPREGLSLALQARLSRVVEAVRAELGSHPEAPADPVAPQDARTTREHRSREEAR